MQPIKVIEREMMAGIEGDLERAGVAYTAENIPHDGAVTGETKKIVYTSPETGRRRYVKAVYGYVGHIDSPYERLEYYDADFTAVVSQLQAHMIGNACVLRDSRFTPWELDFVRSLIDRRLLDDVEQLTDKQMTTLHGIAQKICN